MSKLLNKEENTIDVNIATIDISKQKQIDKKQKTATLTNEYNEEDDDEKENLNSNDCAKNLASVEKTKINTSLSSLDKKGLPWKLMQYVMYFDRDFTNIEIFMKLLGTDEKGLNEVIGILEKSSLVQLIKRDELNGIKIDVLIQNEVKEYINSHLQESLTKEEIYTPIAKVLDGLIPLVDANSKDEKLQKAKIYVNDVAKLANLCNKLGQYYYQVKCNIKKGLCYQEQALEIYQELPKTPNPYIAQSLNNIGICYYKLGDTTNIKKGLSYCTQALEMRKKLYKEPSYYIAQSLNNVGIGYQNLGDDASIKKGLPYLEQALEMRKKLYKEPHLDLALSLNNVGSSYNNLDYKEKYLEYMKQAYLMYKKLNGANHQKTKGYLQYQEIKDFITNNEKHYFIAKSGSTDEKVISIEQKIYKKVLKPICEKSAKGIWDQKGVFSWGNNGFGKFVESLEGNRGVKGYAADKFLAKILGKLSDSANLKIAKKLCFEAICLGIAAAKDGKKDYTCAVEFAKAHPKLIKEITSEHPEYFVDGEILKNCKQYVGDNKLVDELLGINDIKANDKFQDDQKEDNDEDDNFDGEGTQDYSEVASYWNKYSKIGMKDILDLRLKSIDAKDVTIITPDYIIKDTDDSSFKLVAEISDALSKSDKILVPVNLNGKHWVGLAVEKALGQVIIHYMDSEQNDIPAYLKEILSKVIAASYPSCEVKIVTDIVEMQKSNNCGLEVIENFVWWLTGERFDQEDTLKMHSMLYEQNLLLGDTSDLAGW